MARGKILTRELFRQSFAGASNPLGWIYDILSPSARESLVSSLPCDLPVSFENCAFRAFRAFPRGLIKEIFPFVKARGARAKLTRALIDQIYRYVSI